VVALTHDRKEDQDLVRAVRDGDTVAVRLRERTFTPEEFRDFQRQIKRTAWLARCQELLDEETTVRGRGHDVQDEGECHECGFQGLMVENRQRTVYCPKCRSTNVSWPVIENGLKSVEEGDTE
jgi:predicted Zn-ribbon and HTH transcriptional regulator